MLAFLQLHVQPNVGFYSIEPINQMSHINMRGSPTVRIVSSKITFINNKPKNFFKLELQLTPHPALSDEEVEDQRIVTTYK